MIRSLLRLCRIPNVFTALANVLAGAILARGGDLVTQDLRALAASALLYWAGMVLNDFFDRRVDAEERPDRPIPSGEVSAGLALALGLGFLVGGVALVWNLGPGPRLAALLLAGSIIGYDAKLKRGPLGPVAMGACRFLNVSMGLLLVPSPAPWMWIAPAVMGYFTAVITYLARDEVPGSAIERTRASAYMFLVLLVLFTASLLIAMPLGIELRVLAVLILLGLLSARGYALFAPLLHDASGPTIGRAIGGGILLMPTIDATAVAAAGHWLWALAVLALTLPALVLKRWYYIT